MKDYIIASDFLKALGDAGILPNWEQTHRVVIDATVGDLVKIYVDAIPSEALLDLVPLMEKGDVPAG
jgi:hypothetical protein